jgi:hypothetical protein
MFFILAILSFVFGQATWAFWLLIASFFNGLLAFLRTLIDPDWYISRRMAAGLPIDVYNPTASFKVNKTVSLTVLAGVIFFLGRHVGYL